MEIKKGFGKPKLRVRKTRKEREDILKQRMGLKFFNSKELALLKGAFKKLDLDKSGEIDIEELQQIFNSLGCGFISGKVLNFFNDADKNGSKRIDFDEFLDSISSELKLSEEVLRQVFSKFIGNDDGDCITFENLKKLNTVYNDKELKELIDATDSSHTGKVNFEDFYKMITTKV